MPMAVMSSKLLYMPVDINKKDKDKGTERLTERKLSRALLCVYTVYRKKWINNQTKDKRMTIACDNW